MTTNQDRPGRAHTVTVIRMHREGDHIALVVSVDPFGPNPSAHVQNYHMNNATKRGHLVTDSPYRTEAAAVAAFDRMHPADEPREIGTDKPGPAEHECRGY